MMSPKCLPQVIPMDLPVLPPRQHIVELLGGGGRVPEHLVLLKEV